MNSDSIMLDSPAQTPTPKSQPPPPTHSTSSDVAMSDTTTATTAAAALPMQWLNNTKWTEEYQAADARLLHRDAFKRREHTAPTTQPRAGSTDIYC